MPFGNSSFLWGLSASALFVARLGDPQCQQPNQRCAHCGHARVATVAIGGAQMGRSDG
jgi:hypothetical protein